MDSISFQAGQISEKNLVTGHYTFLYSKNEEILNLFLNIIRFMYNSSKTLNLRNI